MQIIESEKGILLSINIFFDWSIWDLEIGFSWGLNATWIVIFRKSSLDSWHNEVGDRNLSAVYPLYLSLLYTQLSTVFIPQQKNFATHGNM